jgi:hypothetical protein
MRQVLALLFLLLPMPAMAASAVSCHCFRDRSFDPAKPAAADPYVLATAENSLLAAAFGTDKKGIVSAKMTGNSGGELWVAHWAAEKLGLRPEELLDARSRAANWSAGLAGLGVDASRLGAPAVAALRRPDADGVLAALAVDDVIASRLGMSSEVLRAVRARGAGDAATVAASILSRLGGQGPEGLYAAVVRGAATWGGLFHSQGVEPADIEEAVRKLLR